MEIATQTPCVSENRSIVKPDWHGVFKWLVPPPTSTKWWLFRSQPAMGVHHLWTNSYLKTIEICIWKWQKFRGDTDAPARIILSGKRHKDVGGPKVLSWSLIVHHHKSPSLIMKHPAGCWYSCCPPLISTIHRHQAPSITINYHSLTILTLVNHH